MNKIILVILLQFFVFVRSEEGPSVVIIGAGAAGIAAATKLFQNGITSVKILEAENRIGGRIHSVEFGDGIVDLGAEWCVGADVPVYDVIKKLNLVELSDFSQTFYHSSGKGIDQEFAEELKTIFEDIYYIKIEVEEGITLGEYMREKYTKEVTEKYGDNPKKLEFALEFLNVIEKELLLTEGVFSWDDVTAKCDYEETAEQKGLNWKGRGFKTVLDVILQRYPDPSDALPIEIILNKEVKKISWNDEYVTVECFDNSTFKADHVILTVSLGVLKHRHLDLFEPELPEYKKYAIQELGIAAVAKILFYFPNKWWPDDFKTIDLVWTEKDKVEFLQQHGKDKSWLLDLTGFYPVPKNPKVLETWFGGKTVPEIEMLSDEVIIDGIMLILNKFVGNTFQNITRPQKILHHNWYNNPHFRGTYSYQTIKSRKREISGEEALSKPLSGKLGNTTLLFAGEATNSIHYATVHGALETGYREAERLISLYQNTQDVN